MRRLNFSAKLDCFRRLKSWSIRELARRVGMRQEHLEYLLEGKHQPQAQDIFRIQAALDIHFELEDF